MICEEQQSEARSLLCHGVDVGLLGSGSQVTDSFAELIRAREEQQRRIVSALEEQNRQLRARLSSEEGRQSVGEATNSSVTGHRQHPSTSSPSLTRQNTIPVEEFVTFVTQMKDLINCAQQADLVTLQALQDRVEFQNREHARRITELETQMIAIQRREEFGCNTGDGVVGSTTRPYTQTTEEKQSLQYVMSELKNIRDTTEEVTGRMRQLHEVFERHQASVRLLERDLNGLETKMVDVEAMPSLFRRQVMTLEERYAGFTHRIREEVSQLQQQQHQQQESHQFPQLTGLAEDRVGKLKKLTTEEFTDIVVEERDKSGLNEHEKSELHQLVSCLLEEKVQDLKGFLEGFISEKVKHLEVLRSASTVDKEGSAEEKTVAKSGMCDVAMTKLMEDLTRRIQDIEMKMQAPTDDRNVQGSNLDEERIENLTKEVEGATVMLESAIARRVSLGIDTTILDTKEMMERVTRVETRVQGIEERLNDFTCTQPITSAVKVCNENSLPETKYGSVEAPSLKGDINNLTAFVEHRQQQERVSRQLQEEMELAAACLRAKAAEQLSKAYGTPSMDDTTPVQSTDRNLSVPHLSYAPPTFINRPKMRAVQQHQPPQNFGPFKAPPVLISSETVAKAVAELRERKRQKEDAVTKVVASLQEIQKRFSDLSERESTSQRRSTHRTCRERSSEDTCVNSVDMLESIAGRKEAIYAKEKQLLSLRNALWREIAQLEEEERLILSS